MTLELGAFRARLEERINTNLYLIRGMAANISVRPGMPPGSSKTWPASSWAR